MENSSGHEIDQQRKDRFNSLPDHIIVNLLSLIPLEDAVRTAVLSHRWRYLWTQLDSLYISFTDFHNIFNFSKILNKVLQQLTSPAIRKIVMKPDDGNYHYCCNSKMLPYIPTRLFQISSLVSLDLRLCEALLEKLPKNEHGDYINLPCLEKLRIELLFIYDLGLLEKLINSCPSLKDLYLDACARHPSVPFVFTICGKNMRRLFIKFYFEGKVVIDAPKLECFGFYISPRPKFNFSVECNAIELREAYIERPALHDDEEGFMSELRATLSTVRSLTVTSTRLGAASITFPYLTRLKLEEYRGFSFNIEEFLQFLTTCPVLEILVVYVRCVWNWDDDIVSWGCPQLDAPPCLLIRIKRIEIRSWHIYRPIFFLMQYLLLKAQVLELLSFKSDDRGILEDEQIKESMFCKELYGCQRSSSRCQIEFSGCYVKVPRGATIEDHVESIVFHK